MMARKPLTALQPGRQKDASPAAAPAEAVSSPQQAKQPVPPSRQNLKAITSYHPPEVRKQLKAIANEEDMTVQQLMGEALNLLFARYGRPEIAPTNQG